MEPRGPEAGAGHSSQAANGTGFLPRWVLGWDWAEAEPSSAGLECLQPGERDHGNADPRSWLFCGERLRAGGSSLLWGQVSLRRPHSTGGLLPQGLLWGPGALRPSREELGRRPPAGSESSPGPPTSPASVTAPRARRQGARTPPWPGPGQVPLRPALQQDTLPS